MFPVGGWVAYLDSKPVIGTINHEPQPVTLPDDMVPREAHSWFLNDASGANGAGYYLAVGDTEASVRHERSGRGHSAYRGQGPARL